VFVVSVASYVAALGNDDVEYRQPNIVHAVRQAG